ncbi:MAG: DUF5615 family PIN-like protein [Leptospirales bacterium]
MKLLLDENLSRRMLTLLSDPFPESTHVSLIGLQHANDAEIWSYAGKHGFVIVTRDSDFSDMAALYGPPPKVVRLCMGNCGWKEMVVPLVEGALDLSRALERPNTVLVELL